MGTPLPIIKELFLNYPEGLPQTVDIRILESEYGGSHDVYVEYVLVEPRSIGWGLYRFSKVVVEEQPSHQDSDTDWGCK